MIESGHIEIYQTDDGQTRIEVRCGRLEQDTLWLSQAQMAELFDRDVRTVNEHIRNVFAEVELDREATVRKFRIVRQEGAREVTREIEHYDLDVAISVGYRVNSKKGTQFRIWPPDACATTWSRVTRSTASASSRTRPSSNRRSR